MLRRGSLPTTGPFRWKFWLILFDIQTQLLQWTGAGLTGEVLTGLTSPLVDLIKPDG